MKASLPMTTGELAMHVLRQHARAFAEHAPEARTSTDTEHVHQTRVATRRMRAALRVFGDVLPDELSGLSDELKWIAEQLGPVRDLDVQHRRVEDTGAALGVSQALLPYGAWLEEARQRALASLIDAFQSERFLALMDRLERLEQIQPKTEADQPVSEDAPARMKKAFRRLRKVGDELDVNSKVAEFHKARIRAKRLRYTVEFFVPIYGKPAERLVKNTTALQDLLGDHQDGVVSAQLIQEAVRTSAETWPPETMMALGRVVQWEAHHGEELRREFRPTYREVRDAWRRLRESL